LHCGCDLGGVALAGGEREVRGAIESSASIGVAVFAGHRATVEAPRVAADAATYRAKTWQHGSYWMFDPALDGEASTAMAWRLEAPMTSQTLIPLARAWTAALVCVLAVGCSTAPRTPAPNPKAAKISALRNLGFAPANDGWELSLGVKLPFDSDVKSVSDEGRPAVAGLAHTLGTERIRVEGPTDNVGNAKYNAGLSQRRAESVAKHLIRFGWRDDAIERRL
jgi:outer membrane protein OmpA-like peptidoglycan-associated protein